MRTCLYDVLQEIPVDAVKVYTRGREVFCTLFDYAVGRDTSRVSSDKTWLAVTGIGRKRIRLEREGICTQHVQLALQCQCKTRATGSPVHRGDHENPASRVSPFPADRQRNTA